MPTPRLTDEECQAALDAVAEHGGITAAADALGTPRGTLQSRVNEGRRRKSGMIVTGRSTLTDLRTGEPVMEWVKESLDRQRAAEAQQAAYTALAEKLPRITTVPFRASAYPTQDHLCTVYTLTDCHVGALAWHKEGGADWDLAIAEDTLVGAFQHMIARSPASELGIVNQLGDFLHWDGLEAWTPTSHHLLDADGRFEKIVAVAIRILRRVVDMALDKHPKVHVILAEGNHDIASSVWLRQMFGALYEKEPRVTVEQSPLPYYAVEWGNTLLAFHHGHLKKNDQLADYDGNTIRRNVGPHNQALLPHRPPPSSRGKRAFGDDRVPASDAGGKGRLLRSRRMARDALGNRRHLSQTLWRSRALNSLAGHAAMTPFDLGDGKQVVVNAGYLQIWANRGCLGVQLTPEQMQEIGLTMYQVGRRAKRQLKP